MNQHDLPYRSELPAESEFREPSFWDGDLAAILASFAFHLALLLALGLIPFLQPQPPARLTLTAVPESESEEPLLMPEDFSPSELPAVEVGAQSVADTGMALSLAPVVADLSQVPSPVDYEPVDLAKIEINHAIEAATGLYATENLPVRGAAGEGTTGVLGAIDRITQEILLSLEERKTLVVWLFDQSGSLYRQRQTIQQRLDRIYTELGVIEAAENEAFARHDDKPLLTTVAAFGSNFTVRAEETDNVAEIKEAVAGIELDDSGVERVFTAVYRVAEQYKKLRTPGGRGEPERNVLVVVLTDEAGDDQDGLEPTVKLCRRYEIPVYVIGVPAPFGRVETLVKWVDPDPNYDQTPRWGSVNQGPESMLPERIRLYFAGQQEDEAPLDSGFGPFALTRLAYETGGIYFTVHPNRSVHRAVGRGQVEPFSAHLKHFFDPEIMRRYRPDYVSADEYLRRVNANKARSSLLQVAQLSWVTPMEDPQLRFVKRDEASFANELTEAQKSSAKLEPQVERMYETLKLGEADRPSELSPRWQAGYDLAMGRVLAVLVRTQSYNAMLAQAKRGMPFKDPKNNTWILKPAGTITVNSKLQGGAEKARELLERVRDEHAGTPWAMLAERELATPLGWEWVEEFTDLSPPPPRPANPGNNARPAPPRNDQPNRIPPRPPTRPVPKL